MVLQYVQNYLRFHDTLESAKEFVKKEGGKLDSTGHIAGTPFRVEIVSGKGTLTENGKIPSSERVAEVSDLLMFSKEFSFFASDAKFWQQEGKISTRNYKVQRLDGDILNHTVKYDDVVLVYSYNHGHTSQQNQLDAGKKVVEQVRKLFGCVPGDLYIAANLKPHIEIPELSRRFGLERSDFWTVWKPQSPLNFFYKRCEWNDEKDREEITETRIEKGYAICYPWTLYPAYVSISPETFGVVRTTKTPYENWEEVGEDFKIPPKEILSAKEVTKRLLNGEPFKDFENVGVTIAKPKGLHQYGYRHHASGIDVPWEQLRWEADAGIPENCKNIGISQSYFLVADKDEAFIVKSLDGTRFLEMPSSDYGALVIGDNEQAREFRAKIREKEEIMLSDDYFGYMIDKIEYDDVWYAIKVLPDGRYQLEEWSDSSSENDKWVLESVDECYHKVHELNPETGYTVGQEVDYRAMDMECLGSIDSNHSLMTFKLLYDSGTNRYFVLSDDASGKDEVFILEHFGTAQETIAWLKEASIPEKTADTLSMLVSQNEATQ